MSSSTSPAVWAGLASLGMLGWLSPAAAQPSKQPAEYPSKQAASAPSVDLALLKGLLARAVPTAHVEPLAGAGNSIILTGGVTRVEDIDTILAIARQFAAHHGVQSAIVINALRTPDVAHAPEEPKLDGTKKVPEVAGLGGLVSEKSGAAPAVSEVTNAKVQPGQVRWHPTFAAAGEAARRSGKPVLFFQMMGKLDEQFC